MSTAVATKHHPEKNYLTADHTIASWLLTTDHKRIAVLYLISITFFFFIGSIAAGMVRLELTSSQGLLLTSEAYNKMFSAHGVVSRFGVDFLVYRDAGESAWRISALEINLRMGGTTHPYLALQFLTGGSLDPQSGLFRSPSGQVKYYKATDNLYSPRYRGLLPEDLVDLLTINKLHYSHGSESGVLFHLIGAVDEIVLRHGNAYSEQLAESNNSHSNVPMWI